MQIDLDANIELGKTRTSKEIAKTHAKVQDTYYALVRNLIVWATLVLTLITGFANKLHRPHPACLWLLQACLGLLAITVLAGILVSYGEVRLHELTAGMLLQKYQDLHAEDMRSQVMALKTVYSVTIPKKFPFAFLLEIWSFALAIFALAIFAIANL